MPERPTDVNAFGESIYTQLPQFAAQDDLHNWALLIYLGAISIMFDVPDSLAHGDGGDPWTLLLDINRVPDYALSWLGQYVGIAVDTSLPYDRQRQQIRDKSNWQRGTVEALKQSIRDRLTGTKTVRVVERDGSAYKISVVTYENETPAGITYQTLRDSYATYQLFFGGYGTYAEYWASSPRNAIAAKLQEAKAAALVLTYTVTPGGPGTAVNYEALWLDYLTYDEVRNALQSYEDVYIRP